MGFLDDLTLAMQCQDSRLCLRLDPPLPPEAPRVCAAHLRAIVGDCAAHVCAFKVNTVLYEAHGLAGYRLLEQVCTAVRKTGLPLIVDGKRADSVQAAIACAHLIYDVLGAQACTAHPYPGHDTVCPLRREGTGFVFVVCRTPTRLENSVQGVLTIHGCAFYESVATLVQQWAQPRAYGLLVSASDPTAAGRIAAAAPHLWLLVSDVGEQDTDVLGVTRILGPHLGRTIWGLPQSLTGSHPSQAQHRAAWWQQYLNQITSARDDAGYGLLVSSEQSHHADDQGARLAIPSNPPHDAGAAVPNAV